MVTRPSLRLVLMLGLLASLAPGCLNHSGGSSPAPAPAPIPVPDPNRGPVPIPLKRGQWTQWHAESGTLTNNAAHWVSTGVEQDVNGLTVPAGQSVLLYFDAGRTTAITDEYTSWCSAAFDTDRNRFIMSLAGGHGTVAGNEVNEFDIASGTWNPDGRPADPTTRLLKVMGDVTPYPGYPAPPANYWPLGVGPTHQASPGAVIDSVGTYAHLVIPDHESGFRLFPKSRHTYGGVVYMPSVRKVLYLSGQTETPDSLTGGAPPAEWDPTARKWEVITPAEWDKIGYADSNISTTWDSKRNRVIIVGGHGLHIYNPVGPYGSRISTLVTEVMGPQSLDYQQSLYDPKRDRVVFFNSKQMGAGSSGSQIGSGYWGFQADGTLLPGTAAPTIVTITGDTGFFNFPGPGAIYDPVSDRYVIWIGGKKLYSIDPNTWASQASVASGGDTPGSPPFIWNRFFYIPAYDAYGTISDVHEKGMSIFAPAR